ncbi:MAG: hypothetical protein JNK58_04680 [Phycisphaerae bacterium]|nr:hypothetical protein [Phycisphaerae bacterium]
MNDRTMQLAMCLVLLMKAASAHAWDGHGHRLVTELAMDAVRLDPLMPSWLGEASSRQRAMYQSVEPDRWRGQRTPALSHINNPDHYIDIEDLAPFGLTIDTMPNLRSEYIRVMAVEKAAHPERFSHYDPALDPIRDKEFPGYVAHSIIEQYAKLQSSFRTLRTIEAAGVEGRAAQVEQARANVLYHVGVLSHFVADAAQPLHTTQHFNGWSSLAPNPKGYTTSNRFHAYIDGGVVELHHIDYPSLRPLAKFDLCVKADDPWNDIIAHIKRSFAHVEDLYRMEQDGSLDQEPGKQLIEERLLDGSAMLYALIRAAWETSEPEGAEIKRFINWTPVESP